MLAAIILTAITLRMAKDIVVHAKMDSQETPIFHQDVKILTSVLTDKGILAKESARTRLEITHAVVHWACVVMVKQVVKDLVLPPLLQLLEELFPL